MNDKPDLFDTTRGCTLEEQLIADALVNRMMITSVVAVLLKTGKFTEYDIRAFKEAVESQTERKPVDFEAASLTGQEFHPFDVPAIKARALYLIDTIFDAMLGADPDKPTKGVCNHANWSFKKDGRRCPDCGVMIADFGD